MTDLVHGEGGPSAGPPATEDARPALDASQAVRARYPGRWVAGFVAAVVLVLLVKSFALSPNIDWASVRSYLGFHTIVGGIRLTVLLAIAAQAVGIAGGVVLAVMRISPNPVLNSISSLYLWFFRGTPVLIQIIFWFNLSLVFPRIAVLGLDVSTNDLITPMSAAVLALGLNEAAYMAEIVRGGIVSVDHGQLEAAASIGLKRTKAMRLVILPQAVRAIIPPTGSEFIAMLKGTSLVSVIAARELMTATQQIYAQNFLTIELLIVASFWYLVMTSITTLLQTLLERRLEASAGGRSRGPAPRLWQKLFLLRSPGSAGTKGWS